MQKFHPPALQYPAELLLRAQAVRLLFLDVDGVLTDGGVYIGEQGESFKRFHILDGHGLKLIMAQGITPVVITGRKSTALRYRLEELGIEQVYMGVKDKLVQAQLVLAELALNWEQCAAVGDDWPDAPLLLRSALSCAPPAAHPEIQALVHYCTNREGGAGCVREVCDVLLIARGVYVDLWQAAQQGGALA